MHRLTCVPLPCPLSNRLPDFVRLQQSGALYGLLMVGSSMVTSQRVKQQQQLHPQDLLLLSNFITCNNAYR